MATPGQTACDCLHDTARALNFFAGVLQLIVPDTPRALVTSANRYEPELNNSVLDFARHPQDKAKFELSGQLMERWVLARLRKHSLATVHKVNDAMVPLLEHLNQRAFQRLPIDTATII